MNYLELLNILIKEIRDMPPIPVYKGRIKDNPELTAKEVEIHPKRGQPYRAIRYVRRDGDDEEPQQQQEEEEEEIPETDSDQVFDESPKSDADLIEQSKVIREWFNKNAASASQEEREEKIKWYINNVNNESQNELADTYVRESDWHTLGGIHGAVVVEYGNYSDFAVFKPSKYELNSSITRTVGGSQVLREVAAYTFAKLFKEFERLIPVTALNAGNDEEYSSIGSTQEFIEGASEYMDEVDRTIEDIWEEYGENSEEQIEFDKNPMNFIFSEEQVLMASIFDSLIWNIDRHQGNFMVDQGDIILIDNGASFPTEINSYVINNNQIMAGSNSGNQDLSSEHITLIESVLERKGEIYKALIPYLDDNAINGIFTRAEKLLDKGKYGLFTTDMEPVEEYDSEGRLIRRRR